MIFDGENGGLGSFRFAPVRVKDFSFDCSCKGWPLKMVGTASSFKVTTRLFARWYDILR